jgi:transposase InsO family protein
MLDQQQLEEWARKLNLSEQAENVIYQIRSSPPVRRVGGGAGNVCGRYPSQKMGVTIQFESHRHELAAIFELEHDSSVIEYYDQPSSIKLNYAGKNGRRIGVIHTPDYFVLRTDSAGYEECKPEAALLRLAKQSPERYQRDEAGQWRCPPGEQFAGQYGFYYRLRSEADIDWVWQRNIQFLEDYLRADTPPVPASTQQTICALVAGKPGISLACLKRQTERVASADDIFTLIATDAVWVDLRSAPLVNLDQVHLFPSRDAALTRLYLSEAKTSAEDFPHTPVMLAVGQTIIWDGNIRAIVNVGETSVALSDVEQSLIEIPRTQFERLVTTGRINGARAEAPSLHPEAQRRLVEASQADLREANRRAELVRAHLRGVAPADGGVPERTLRLWVARYRAAETAYGAGYLGLLPQTARRGNRGRKLPEQTLNLMSEFIEREYETLRQRTKYAAYALLLHHCQERGALAPSYKTFSLEVKRRANAEQTFKRQGRRAAYQRQPFYWELELTTPRHGDRPFEICHLDHTEADIELRCEHTGRTLGRPWVTFLSDAYSRRLLAIWLTFDPPSYRSCMMALRECARRHQRFPQTLVVDGGRDFESVYFETLLARFECTKKSRPPAQPRFGSVCERLFGTATTQFFNNLLGNTQLTRQVRLMTKSVDPKAEAVWTLGRLHARLSEWAYEIYDSQEHPALGQSPGEAFAAGLIHSGHRPHRLIAYDEQFQLLTLPTTRKGTAKIIPSRGVKINGLYYWSDQFRDPSVENTQVPVRYDPYDLGLAWAFVARRWVRCVSEYHAVFHGRSEKELMIASDELRARKRVHSHQFSVTASRLAAFLQSVETEESLLEQRLKDIAMRPALRLINGAEDGPARELSPPPAREIAATADRDSALGSPDGEPVWQTYGEF